MITFPDSSLLTPFLTKLSELSWVFLNYMTNCGRTLVSWELKTTTKITLSAFSNRVWDTLHSLIIQIIEITLSTEGYAHFHVFLLLQSNLYSILLDTKKLCDPPVTSLSKDFKQTNEQLPPPSWNSAPQPVSLEPSFLQNNVWDFSFENALKATGPKGENSSQKLKVIQLDKENTTDQAEITQLLAHPSGKKTLFYAHF